jgi:hypothetical protein
MTVPAHLKAIVDTAAGKQHSDDGAVMRCLAEVLAIHERDVLQAHAQRLLASVQLGSVWCWEPLRPDLCTRVLITGLEWNGEEWMVRIQSRSGLVWGEAAWNTLGRFTEAAVLIAPSSEET